MVGSATITSLPTSSATDKWVEVNIEYIIQHTKFLSQTTSNRGTLSWCWLATSKIHQKGEGKRNREKRGTQKDRKQKKKRAQESEEEERSKTTETF
jgi:hypothetical protein